MEGASHTLAKILVIGKSPIITRECMIKYQA
jgi:hypothetical protein